MDDHVRSLIREVCYGDINKPVMTKDAADAIENLFKEREKAIKALKKSHMILKFALDASIVVKSAMIFTIGATMIAKIIGSGRDYNGT